MQRLGTHMDGCAGQGPPRSIFLHWNCQLTQESGAILGKASTLMCSKIQMVTVCNTEKK